LYLTPYPLFVTAFQIQLDYRLGTPWKKGFVKSFQRKKVLGKPWNGLTLPKCDFMKERVGNGVCKRHMVRKMLVKTLVPGYLT
jgi:hypothetical protein